MVTVVTRAGKGSALTHGEMDANINNLNIGKFASVPATTSGTNTVTVSDDPTEGAYETNHVYEYQIGGTNTGAVTLAIDGLTATAVQTVAGNALIGGELLIGQVAKFLYNGTNFRILNPGKYVVTDYITGGQLYYYSGAARAALDLDNLIADSGAFESIGPSSAHVGGGSGATNEWTVMDTIPPGTAGVLLAYTLSLVTTGAGSTSLQLHLRPGNSSIASTASESQIANFVFDAAAGSDTYTFQGQIAIGLDPSDLTFDATWSAVNDASRIIHIDLIGFYA